MEGNVQYRRRLWVVAAIVAVAAFVAISSGTTPVASGKTSSTAAGLKLAEAALTQATSFPKEIAVTAPHTKPIPKGKSIEWINCGVTACTQEGNVVASAAKILGWKFTALQTTGEPQSVQAAFQTAVTTKPTAVLSTGFNQDEFAPQLKKLAAEGVGVYECCTTDTPLVGGDRLINLSTAGNQGLAGQAAAAWVTVQTKAKANVLYVDLPDYTILQQEKTTFYADLAKYCTGCTVANIDIPLSGIATAASTIVSYLRAHPSVNWVQLCQDALAPGLPAALKAAGLSKKVQFSGIGPTAIDYQYVADGQESATVEWPQYEVLYQLVDAVARHITGESLAPDNVEPTDYHIIDRANVSESSPTIPITKDLVAEYTKLWGR